MRIVRTNVALLVLLTIAGVVVAMGAVAQQGSAPADPAMPGQRALKVITLNTQAYRLEATDKRSVKITAEEDMHIVALEHFTGVGGGSFSDNGHILSTSPDNPWVKWEKAGPGMEPNGTTGYFGYCGRDYYSECAGIDDVMAYETFPAGTHMLIRKGETLYMHCYAAPKGYFHHAVRVLYW